MINTFPKFSRLELRHQQEVTNFTSTFDSYSDFNFTSLFAWNTDNSTEISWLNGNFVIKLPDYLTGEPVISVLGNYQIDATLQQLFTLTSSLEMVPEVVLDSLQDKRPYVITEDRDNYDYMYTTYHVAHLPGQQFKKKRNKINSVKQAFVDTLSVSSPKTINNRLASEIMAVFDTWAQKPNFDNPQRDGRKDDDAAEKTALQRLLDTSQEFDLIVTVVRNNGDLVAFSINEQLGNNTAICHFEKAIPIHSQVNTFIASHAAKVLHDAGCRLVNWEQDLGLPGLRKSKEAYHPSAYLKKFKITRL